MVVFFLAQCFAAPFLDPVSNASEWTSRMNYVLTALLALLVALNVPGHDAFSGWVLYLCVRIVIRCLSFTENLYQGLWDHVWPQRL